MVATAGSRLWRLWLASRFRLWQGRRHRRLTLEKVAGLPVLVLPDAFNPALFFSSEMLARALPTVVKSGSRVLDMGTGSGVQAVVAASLGARVVAVDVSPEACRCARINVLLNRVERRVEVRESDLFAATQGELFDLVLFNPPYYRGESGESWQRAWKSPDILDRFADGLRSVLAPGGRALLVVSTVTAGVHDAIHGHELRSRVLSEKSLPGEQFAILEWMPSEESSA